MKEIPITFKASRNIIKQSQLCPVETGGILVGTTSPLTIVAAGDPGLGSTRQAALFTSDPEADRACLSEARKQYGDAVTGVGYWHKHPEGYTEPSPGDCRQVRQLIEDYNDGQPVLMGIVNYRPNLGRHKTTLHLYSINPEGQLVEYEWKLVSCKNQKLMEAIRKAPARPDLKPMSYWLDKDFQFYLNPIGRERIKKEELNLKKAAWNVTTARCKQDGVLLLDILKDKIELRLVLPPEFPLNAPIVLTADGQHLLGLDTVRGWNSLSHLVDVAAEAAAVMICPRCKSQCIVSPSVAENSKPKD